MGRRGRAVLLRAPPGPPAPRPPGRPARSRVCPCVNILERLLANTAARPGALTRANEFTISSNFLVNRRYTLVPGFTPGRTVASCLIKARRDGRFAIERPLLFYFAVNEAPLIESSKTFGQTQLWTEVPKT